MFKSIIKHALPVVAISAPVFAVLPVHADDYPSKPVELVCSTKPGSGAANWCNMMGQELAKPGFLGVPVNVVFKSAGNNNEPVVYTYNKPADGYTLMHMSASFSGYFNLPSFTRTFDDFEIISRVETTLYGIAVRCDDKDIKSWADLVKYSKAHPGELAMGSNKVGSNHHRHHMRVVTDPKGPDLRFVPYEGTGGVVKDVVGGHLRVGFAQPGLWDAHIQAGTICPLLILDDNRLTTDPLWKDVPNIREAGLTYDIPYQWQGFLVKKGTPDAVKDKMAAAIKKVTETAEYKAYLKTAPEVIANFEGDRKKLNADFKKALADTKQFMIENGMIKG